MDITAPALVGRFVRLEPLAEEHREGLRSAADDERIWEHMTGVARGPEFDRYFDNALAEEAARKRVPFAVRLLATGVLVGGTAYLDPVPMHRRVEIGSTWYRPDVWATAVNPECKLLLLAHAFDTLGLNRVTFVTDVRNLRSQAAIAKLGAVREGVLRAHMITRDGRIRDSVIFGITAAEWPGVRERLVARLAGRKVRVLFVCVENSNRSQMAQAFAALLGGDRVEALSAGSRPSGRVNPKAVEAMRELDYDLTTHTSKGLAAFDGTEIDAAVTMGCGDACPLVRAARRYDWQIPDPREMPPEEFRQVRDLIRDKVRELLAELGAIRTV
jgi:RimJ/RimL family protein N-acetyltransferase/protein-tyrosine-phosphatase